MLSNGGQILQLVYLKSAAEVRANNQGAGRVFGSALLGPKFRKAMRASAASSNAAIVQDVAKKRPKIEEGKMEGQDLVSHIQAELKARKEEYKSLATLAKSQTKAKATTAKTTTDSVGLLKKLKKAYDLGLLTDQEYEEKRKKIVSNIWHRVVRVRKIIVLPAPRWRQSLKTMVETRTT